MFFFRIFILLLLSIVSLHASAAEWLAEPSVFLKTYHNDNIRLVAVNEEADTGYTLEPKLVLEGRENSWDIKLDTKLKAVRYSGEKDLDSDDVFLKLSGVYSTELSQLGFNLGYTDNTTFDLDYDTQSNQSGLTNIPVEMEIINFSPYWYKKLSENTNVSIGFNASSQEYDQNAPLNYNDFESSGGNISIGWDYSEKTTLGFIVRQSTTESEDLDYENDTQKLQLSYDYNVSQNADLSIQFGKSKVDYVYHNVEVCQGVYIFGNCFGGTAFVDNEGGRTVNNYSLEYTNKYELNEVELALSRSITTSSSGSATQTDKYSTDYTRQLSKRLDARFLLSFQESESLDELDTDQDAKRFRFEPTVVWKLTEDMDLRFLYRYLKQKYAVSNSERVSNSVYLNLSVRWPKAISTY